MRLRNSVLVCAILWCASLVSAKDKNKLTLPAFVLNAQTVCVLVHPGSEVPLANPGENRMAQDAVEQALSRWGRFTTVLDPSYADLVISVRRGRAVSPTIAGGDPTRTGIGYPPLGGEAAPRIDIGSGGSTRTTGYPGDRSPHPGMEMGSPEDTFEVYRGQTSDPLDATPLWRYTARNSLQPPTVPAVQQFRKQVEEAEKQQAKQKKHP